MLITIIIVAIFIVCLIIVIATAHKYKYDNLNMMGAIGIVVFGIGSVMIAACVISNYLTVEINYENTLYAKQVLEYRLETKSENLTGNELLYSEIVEFNNELRKVKRYANSPWTSWFYNPKIAAMDYIEIPEMTYAKLEPIKEN